MMQMSSSVASHNNNVHIFQMGRRGSCKCQASLAESLRLVTSSDATKLHLANLDKLLKTQNPLEQVDIIHKQEAALNKKSKTFLEGLNLGRLWTDVKGSEEMSPRHLKRLQRLLSMSNPEYSPRNVLGTRWREYHGSNDWKGMLDPLDHNLRREVVRYGEFVQAAYHSFHSNPDTSSSSSEVPPRPMVLPDRSYRVTKNLYATSSIALPDWAPMGQRSSWIGYVAVCDDRREIARMGRRDIVISLRGTATCLEWAENMRAQLAPYDGNEEHVESGFLSLYRTRGAHVDSLAESVREEVRRLKEMYKGETLSITVTGHSLGAALALLVADDVSNAEDDVAVAVFSFGGPRVGNKAFGERITRKKVKVLRIVNSQDVITRVPGILVSQEMEEQLSNSKVGNMLMLGYSHVGSELRVDTKNSPYLKPDADMACCHDLEAYLHLVDGFFASDSPFRTNAKRSLATLLQHQPSNVKNLYTNMYKAKAKALTLNIERRPSFSMSTCMPSPS